VIRGFFRTEGPHQRPYVDVVVQFPIINRQALDIAFLVDTGADRTILSPFDASRLREQFGVDLLSLPAGAPSTGVGGRASTRRIEATLNLGDFSTDITLAVLEPPPGRLPGMPSLLGRDIISRFALFVEERTARMLLLNALEADAVNLPIL
jgi:predicted aspartyl protease